MKIFETWKFEKYNSDINKTWPRYVPPEYLHIPKNEGVNDWVGGGASKKQSKNAIKLTKSRL